MLNLYFVGCGEALLCGWDFLVETFTTMALVCNDVIGTISLGPPLMPNSIES